jgi:hypothetical protein
MDQQPSLFIGQTFLSITAAKEAVLAEAIAQGLSFKVTHSDKKRFHVICGAKDKTGCPFHIRIALMSQTTDIQLRKLVPHTCDFTSHEKWRRSNNAKLIASRHNDMIRSDFQIKPNQIQNIERLQFSNQIPYSQAWRAKREVQKAAFMDKYDYYQLICPFLESITDKGLDPDLDEDADGNYATSRADAAISRDPSNNQFQWCIVAPRACINAFWSSRRFICLDGAHMKSEKELILLIITTLDANENTLPLMWGFATSESTESWTNFLKYFRQFFIDSVPDIEERESYEYLTIVSDRAKGLVPAVSEVLPKAFQYHCTQHLSANVGTEFGKNCEKLFRAACLVESRAQFKDYLDQIQSCSVPAREYVDHIDAKRYATSAAPLVDFPRFGQTCSNIVESMNNAWMEARQLPLLHSLHYIWTYMMRKFYERRHEPQKHEKFTNYCMEYFKRELQESNQYLIVPQERENQVALAYRANTADRSTRIVHLKAKKCSCLAFQDHRIPCRHAIAAARFFQVDPLSLIADFYQVSTYREQYKFTLHTTLLSELEQDGVTLPPPPRALLRGRKAMKRLKRTTRETEARRLGRMKSPETQARQREEAQARYQSGANHFQHQSSASVSNHQQLRAAYQHPQAALNRQTSNPAPFSLAQPPDISQQSDIWTQIRDLQTMYCGLENMTSNHRTATNQSSGQIGNQIPNHQETQTNIDDQFSRTEQPFEEQPCEEQPCEEQPQDLNETPLLEDTERRNETPNRLSSSPSNFTYNFQGPVNSFNHFNIASSASLPNFTQNITPSPTRKRGRGDTEEREGEEQVISDENGVDVTNSPVRRSTRPSKKSRKARNVD